jgi:S-formylglutathione hydrolase FrmB
MKPTDVVLIDPGVIADQKDCTGKPVSSHSAEYDSPSDQYARFLEEELLAEVTKHVKISSNLSDRDICGSSSDGICVFTIARQKPDRFRIVMSDIRPL